MGSTGFATYGAPFAHCKVGHVLKSSAEISFLTPRDRGTSPFLPLFHDTVWLDSGQVQGTVAAVVWIAESFYSVAEAMGKREEEAVVWDIVVLFVAAHGKIEAAAYQHEGDVVEGMAVAFAKFVRPNEEGAV
jgi:hypothetical protein